MKLLPELGFLAAGTRRSLAYVEAMTRAGAAPQLAILLDDGGEPARAVAAALAKAGVSCTRLATTDVNAPQVIAAIGQSAWQIVLFSGPPGAIVRGELLASGRRFLHIHPGALPSYRGSTTIYYSLLESSDAAATALYLDAGIDTGPVIASRRFAPPPDRTGIDHGFDPAVRAAVLEDVLHDLASGRPLEARPQPSDGRVHYIIHPVLKHIAILAGDGRPAATDGTPA